MTKRRKPTKTLTIELLSWHDVAGTDGGYPWYMFAVREGAQRLCVFKLDCDETNPNAELARIQVLSAPDYTLPIEPFCMPIHMAAAAVAFMWDRFQQQDGESLSCLFHEDEEDEEEVKRAATAISPGR